MSSSLVGPKALSLELSAWETAAASLALQELLLQLSQIGALVAILPLA